MAAPVMMGCQGMRCACIDIGSNTTRVLVADVDGRAPARRCTCEKAFTRLGRVLRRTGTLPLDRRRDRGADRRRAGAPTPATPARRGIRVVATAAIRRPPTAPTLLRGGAGAHRRARSRCSTGERGGAAGVRGRHRTRTRSRCRAASPSSTSAAARRRSRSGRTTGGVEWSASMPLGSGSLADAHLRARPAGGGGAARRSASRPLPRSRRSTPAGRARRIAVGGSATSMARLVGGAIDARARSRARSRACAARRAEVVAREHGLDPERVRLLPAGLQLLEAVGRAAGLPAARRPRRPARGRLPRMQLERSVDGTSHPLHIAGSIEHRMTDLDAPRCHGGDGRAQPPELLLQPRAVLAGLQRPRPAARRGRGDAAARAAEVLRDLVLEPRRVLHGPRRRPARHGRRGHRRAGQGRPQRRRDDRAHPRPSSPISRRACARCLHEHPAAGAGRARRCASSASTTSTRRSGATSRSASCARCSRS